MDDFSCTLRDMICSGWTMRHETILYPATKSNAEYKTNYAILEKNGFKYNVSLEQFNMICLTSVLRNYTLHLENKLVEVKKAL